MSTDNNPHNRTSFTKISSDDYVSGVNTRPATQTERSYRDGYVQGRNVEESRQYERERDAESNGLASGVIIGGILALSLGIGAAVWAYWNRTESPVIVQPQVTRPVPSTSPSPAATSPNKTTVIERTIEKAAPPAEVKIIEVPKAVPVPAAPSPSMPNSSVRPAAPANPSTGSSSSDSSSSNPASSNSSSTNQSAPGASANPNSNDMSRSNAPDR